MALPTLNQLWLRVVAGVHTVDGQERPVPLAVDAQGRLLLEDMFLEYGMIYTEDGVASQDDISAQVKFTLFASDGQSSSGVIPDHANDQLTLTRAGNYLIFLSLSMSGTANSTFEAHIAVDGVQQESAGLVRKFGGALDVGSASCVGIVSVMAGQVLTILIENVGVGDIDVVLLDGQLMCVRIGG